MISHRAQAAVSERVEKLSDVLNERARRLFGAAEAIAHGHGGIAMVARATGLAPRTIGVGTAELRAAEQEGGVADPSRVRRPGGGRKKATDKDPTLASDLEALLEPATRGDLESPLRWTSKSIRRLADELVKQGHATSALTVASLLKQMGYTCRRTARRCKARKTRTETRSSSTFETGWKSALPRAIQ